MEHGPLSSGQTDTKRKGIVLAGGTGSRLHPLTSVVNKQLMPVYDKPLVYYPISTLMFAGIRQIMVVSTPEGRPQFESLLGDGGDWGMEFSFGTQSEPGGIAQALLVAKDFLDGEACALVLGDNIFFGNNLIQKLRRVDARPSGASVFGYRVDNPEDYGVLVFDSSGKVTGIVEKPADPPSDYAVTGLYFFDGRASELAGDLTPSARGELEITDLNLRYLEEGDLHVEVFGRGFAWLDAGTPESLLAASDFVRTVELRQGLKASCPEEIAYRMGFIDQGQVSLLAERFGDNPYGKYLHRVAREKRWEWEREGHFGRGTGIQTD